jgi:hypothetical protein
MTNLLFSLFFSFRYCPTHRTGWNWELPKFIKKIKTPDYKGERFEKKKEKSQMSQQHKSFK